MTGAGAGGALGSLHSSALQGLDGIKIPKNFVRHPFAKLLSTSLPAAALVIQRMDLSLTITN